MAPRLARIEDHALIGGGRGAALVGRDGTIPWLCLPRFDSPACFAALLGERGNGQWQIAPAAPFTSTRAYRGDTMVLETLFRTSTGLAALIDGMSLEEPGVVRVVEGHDGAVPFHLELILRPGFGLSVPPVTLGPEGAIAVTGGDRFVIRGDAPLRLGHEAIVADFTVRAGERVCFSLSHSPSHGPAPPAADPHAVLVRTESAWRAWSGRTAAPARWGDAVRRSALVLKALTDADTGAIAAAATTSLPERIGGARNWDYRFCWPRDSALAALALWHTGHKQEPRVWAAWLDRAIGGAPAGLRALYGIGGERFVPEHELPWLAGYEGSRPVRVGNAAATQRQLDVFGEIELALDRLDDPAHWAPRRSLIEHLETIWREPDEGIWEVRGPRRHFTLSKAMAWVAFDRAIRAAERHGWPAPLDRWRRARRAVSEMVVERGFNPAIGAFTQALDGGTLDASLLLLPLIGFLPPTDPRIGGTVDAIGRDLMVDGFIRRYGTGAADDGLPPGEGVFLACGFWYAACLALMDRRVEAETMFERLLAVRNDLGLLAEEYDPRARRQLGNFPQVLSHLALIQAALVLNGQSAVL